MPIDYSPNLTVPEFDAMGYWRCSNRRRTIHEYRAMTVEQRFVVMATMSEGRRRTSIARLRRKRPAIAASAIKDMVINHLLRRADREQEIAKRVAHRASASAT
jgi:hypothetical protein